MTRIAAGLLRHALTTAGGGMVVDGYLTSTDEAKAIGAVMTLAGIGWSAYQKYAAKHPTVAQ